MRNGIIIEVERSDHGVPWIDSDVLETEQHHDRPEQIHELDGDDQRPE
jgi:hypothetical protein